MLLVPADDFETVRSKYIDVIEHTAKIQQHAHWEYGKHPSDQLLRTYIERGEMYFLMDGEDIAGMTVLSMSQGDDYKGVSWQENLQDDEVAVLHLLAVCPAYRGKYLGNVIIDQAMEITAGKGKKALRVDTLKDNIPAQQMYERAGFSCRGEKTMYADNTGILDFVFYEKISAERKI